MVLSHTIESNLHRGTNADKYLLYPIKQTEVAKMLKHTGANWQNPGW